MVFRNVILRISTTVELFPGSGRHHSWSCSPPVFCRQSDSDIRRVVCWEFIAAFDLKPITANCKPVVSQRADLVECRSLLLPFYCNCTCRFVGATGAAA